MVLADVEVEGSYLLMSLRMMSGPTLVVVKHGTVMTRSMSSTDRMHALSTGIVREDAGEDVGHGDCQRAIFMVIKFR